MNPGDAYTLLRVVDRGVILCDRHARRIAPHGGPVLDAFAAFARTAAPGIYAIHACAEGIRVEPRAQSRLADGMPVRFLVSPHASLIGRFPKPAPPCAYDSVRSAGIATILTSIDGREVIEACSAAVVGWNGRELIFPPADRPAVDSVTEQELRAAFPSIEAPLLLEETLPIALINGVKGVCTLELPGRGEFPETVRLLIESVLQRSARRPR